MPKLMSKEAEVQSMLTNESEYRDVFKTIVNGIATARVRALAGVNSDIISLYWDIGRILNAHNEWGAKVVTLFHMISKRPIQESRATLRAISNT